MSSKAAKPRAAARPKPGGRSAGTASRTATEVDAPIVPRMVNIGYGNLVASSRVVAVVSPNSSPMRRLREEATGRGKLVDATQGRRTRSIIVTDSDHVVLSAINPETLSARLAPESDEGSGT